MVLKLAWRNIWRNRRRTMITAASIVFAVVLSVLMDSVKDGILDRMRENIVGLYTGYIQVHGEGYWKERTLEKSFLHSEEVSKQLQDYQGVTTVIPRLESFTLAASESHSKGTMIVCILPEEEDSMTGLEDRVYAGTYLDAADKSVLISEGLADYLELDLADSLVLLGQGYHGVTAVGKFPIKGLVRFGSPELNQGLIYLPLQAGQELFGATGRVTAFVLSLKDIEQARSTAQALQTLLGPDFEVMSWQEMTPELDQFIKGETTENKVFQIVLYLLIAFGIFGTILMMTLEREREFGILIAIGMKKIRLSSMVIVENLMISLLGVFGGLLLSIPAVWYFYLYPIPLSGSLAEAYENFGLEAIFYFSIESEIFINQAMVVLLLSGFLSFFPLIKIAGLKPVTALRK